MSGPARTHEEIESQVRDLQAKAKAAAAANGEDGAAGVPLSSSTGLMDQAIYGNDKFAEYVTSIAANDDADDDDDDQQVGIENGNGSVSGAKAFRAPASYLSDVVDQVSYFVIDTKMHTNISSLLQDHDPLAENRVSRVIDREDEYRRRYRKAVISPERADPFLEGQYHIILSLFLPFSSVMH
jgi:splicing factor 3B subunit 1